VTGKARVLKLYLVERTGTLPSVSPLKPSTINNLYAEQAMFSLETVETHVYEYEFEDLY
jgi:hypothetical protein